MRILNPATGETIREIETDDVASIADKARRARAAQRKWRQTPYVDRAKAIRRFGQLITEREDELAKTLTLEVGKPITQSHNELKGVGGRIQFFLERTEAELADELLLTKDQGGTEERIRHEPLGVVANISAWNYPYFVGANVFVPALLTGNTVLYKPSELSTLTGLSIERALHDAGIPKDAFITVIGAGEAGKALCESAIDGMFFTGSHATGARIARAVSERMLRVQLELGGKDPAYVTDDVDVANAAAAVADGAFYNTGQSCCAVERIYVHAGIWDGFLAEFEKTVKGFVLGDPLSENTYIGALARREPQLELLEQQVSDAVTKGARVVCGGKRIAGPGFFFEPTVLVDVTHDMQVMKDESFGPIIGIAKVGSDEEARDKMNDTEYGLTAAVYTNNRERGERILAELDVGTAYVNCCDRVSPRLPWSGRRHSGVGATLSTYGIEAFTRPKAYHVR
jgi:acyl-CoA reductase-like NAD-dependent aldehyde dehydrogenase